MSGGNVLAHMTDANDDADEEMAQLDEQKRGPSPIPHHMPGRGYFVFFEIGLKTGLFGNLGDVAYNQHRVFWYLTDIIAMFDSQGC